MSELQSSHVFISYIREDKELIDKLCLEFDEYGVNYWIDRNHIDPGARWKKAIREAINNGSYFLACFSDSYTSKKRTFMNTEVSLAIEILQETAYDNKWFIPILLSECDIPARSIGGGETLLDINWVPLHEDWDSGIQRILSVIKPIPSNIQFYISALKSEDISVRKAAIKALGRIGPDAKSAVPVLIENLKNYSFESGTVEALGRIGPDAKSAVPALIEKLKNYSFASGIVEALVRLGADAKSAVPALIENLKNNQFATDTIITLGKLGPDAKAAVPALIEKLKDDYEMTAYYAAKTLGEIGPNALAAVPALIEVLNNDKFRFIMDLEEWEEFDLDEEFEVEHPSEIIDHALKKIQIGMKLSNNN